MGERLPLPRLPPVSDTDAAVEKSQWSGEPVTQQELVVMDFHAPLQALPLSPSESVPTGVPGLVITSLTSVVIPHALCGMKQLQIPSSSVKGTHFYWLRHPVPRPLAVGVCVIINTECGYLVTD